jgi:transcription elongation factor GreB
MPPRSRIKAKPRSTLVDKGGVVQGDNRRSVLVKPSQTPQRDRVLFGASVTFVNDREGERTVTILGADEADISRGEVSLYSSIAPTLLHARVGHVMRMHTPSGVEEVEVLVICYPAIGS